MYIRINELSRELGFDAPGIRGLYLDIDFWLTQVGYNNGNPPILSEDFSMQIVVVDSLGNPLAGTDIIAQVRTNIANHVKEVIADSSIRGERRFRKWTVRTQTDSDNILTNLATLKNYVGSS